MPDLRLWPGRSPTEPPRLLLQLARGTPFHALTLEQAEALSGQLRRLAREAVMPPGVRALPEKLREAWCDGSLHWSGERLPDRAPTVKTKPGMSVSDLIVEDRGR